MELAIPFFVSGALLLLTWLLNRFLESLLRKELEHWASVPVPLHQDADISAPVAIRPISEAMHEELAPNLLMMRISRNNDCVALVISSLSLVASALLLLKSATPPLVPLICAVATFVLAGIVYSLRPRVHDHLSFRGLSISNAVFALANFVAGLLLSQGIWHP